MGFQKKSYKLVWPEGSMWHGLEVRLRGMTFDELQEISKLRGIEGSDMERITPMLDTLAGGLLSWNLEDEDAPVPLAEFRDQDASMLMAIVMEWTKLVGEIPDPLVSDSPNGKLSEEALIPMEIPSSSQLNSNTPN